ncbi:ion channel [Aspergillus terreus]|uniref:Ion channel n=1 Tax=Aspergillus terreus TaxID=33178 RepID=A0A5M3Z4F9_ASPTE|nr:hypothetical protein ATETN484_0007015300 [Aspergillus terreus]GFF15958.1 ion channel [Aspergillus terreus]
MTPRRLEKLHGRPPRWHRLCAPFNLRPPDDDDPQDWWFASTAIPLIAATTAPFANVMSIVALAMPWKSHIVAGQTTPDGDPLETSIKDPSWCLALNATSLACGLAGNVFLLFNFTRTVRYIIALPLSIILWALAMGILIAITSATAIYDGPDGPEQIFSQAYWYAVIAAVQYSLLTIILMANITGYLLGHYPQHFALTDHQRTLILQTTAFGVWLIIGAAVFQRVIGISFAEGLYFSDITILTLGFGDIAPSTAVARGLVFPYAVIGIIILGLIVNSINKFFREIQDTNVLRKHIEKRRAATFEHATTLENLHPPWGENNNLDREATQITYRPHNSRTRPITSTITAFYHSTIGRPPLGEMKEEKDRFAAMRAIQSETVYFRRWYRLILSVLAFGTLWTCGAAVFWTLEAKLTYFEALYFAFCSLLTIGYGDITPTTNASKPFFVVWSLLAIPTMTTLISEMSDTIVAGFKRATSLVADWTVLPKTALYKDVLGKLPLVSTVLQRRDERRRVERGFLVGTGDLEQGRAESPSASQPSTQPVRSSEGKSTEDTASPQDMARRLAYAIQQTAHDVTTGQAKEYTYDEWVAFTQMIRFTDSSPDEPVLNEDEYGVLNWDWIGPGSPLVAVQTEPEWVLHRLCESLIRFVSQQGRGPGRASADEDAPTLRKERDVKYEE